VKGSRDPLEEPLEEPLDDLVGGASVQFINRW
jgi:hypothetical protein